MPVAKPTLKEPVKKAPRVRKKALPRKSAEIEALEDSYRIPIIEERQEEIVRFTKHRKRLKNAVLSRLCSGDLLKNMCAEPEMPSIALVMRWLRDDKEFYEKYTASRLLQMDVFAEDVVSIADESGWDVIIDKNGKPKINGESVNRARLRVETRFKIMQALHPARYGQKVQLRGSGDNGAFELDFKMAPQRGGKVIQVARKGLREGKELEKKTVKKVAKLNLKALTHG